MLRKEWISYPKYLLLALGFGLIIASIQQWIFLQQPTWRFYFLPVLVLSTFGILLARISILRQRLKDEHRQQLTLADDYSWLLALQQSVVTQLNQRQPLAMVLDSLLEQLGQRFPGLVATILLQENDKLRIGASIGAEQSLLQAMLSLEPREQSSLLALAAQQMPLDGQIASLEAALAEVNLRSCWCLGIGEGEVMHGLLLLARSERTLSWDELGHSRTIIQLALLAVVQHQREETLHRFNDQLSALVEAIPDAIFFKDGSGRWLITNQAAKHLFQLEGHPWQGKTDAQLAQERPELSAAHEACIDDDEAAWQQGQLGLFEEQVCDQDGQTRFFEVRKLPLFEEDGSRKAMVIIGRDITERTQYEDELRILSITFESQEGMLIADAKGIILRANKAFMTQTGYRAEELLGQSVAMLGSGRHDKDFYRNMWAQIYSEGFWQGEVWNRRKDGEIYPVWLTITAVRNQADQLTHFVATYSDATERKQAEEKIRHLAFYDPLTSLPNRRLLQDRLEQALVASHRSEFFGALLFIDLDNFKVLNDTQGHLVGDQLLIEVAQRLRLCVREEDTVARLGGDEFVILLEHLHLEAAQAAMQAELVGEKIFAAINQPYQLRGKEQRTSPSIGVTLFRAEQYNSDELLKQADMAMYQAKADGRNTIRFFDPSMQQAVEAKASLEADLRQALENDQLALHYQIQRNDDGTIHGAEALLRWEHPQRGNVPPSEFVPLAEETALILPIGSWILETACRQLHEWSGTELENVRIAINISARQFRQPDFVAEVQELLERYELAPQRVKLELTESLVLDNIEDTIDKMQQLRELGCRFSLDDFGTGYSSLAYLRRLPLDELKIDQSFVKDLGIDSNDDAIVRAIIALAVSLGLNTVAEGVENEQQHKFLRQHGCHTYQGYLFGRPLDHQGFAELVLNR